MRDLISVVIPVYNVQNDLDECVRSVLAQSYPALEIILVDDGSTDGSAKLCDDYARSESSIRVLHKPNGGLSDARNQGVAEAAGALLFFLDADDVLLEPDYLEALQAALEENHAQIAVSDMIRFADGECPPAAQSLSEVRLFTASEAINAMCYGRPFSHSACGKLMRRDCMEGISFPVGLCYEDLATTYRYLDQCERVVYVPHCRYGYREREGSIMRRAVAPYIIDIAKERAAYLERRRPECAASARYSVCKETAGVLAQGWRTLNADARKEALALVRGGLWPALADARVCLAMKGKLLLVSAFPALAAYLSRSGAAKKSRLYQRAKK